MMNIELMSVTSDNINTYDEMRKKVVNYLNDEFVNDNYLWFVDDNCKYQYICDFQVTLSTFHYMGLLTSDDVKKYVSLMREHIGLPAKTCNH